MFCPNCGNYADSNFCPNCGCDLRNIVIKPQTACVPRRQGNNYSSYMQYYPDKLEAIRRLRIDTGMGIAEADRIIDQLFGKTDNYHEDDIALSSTNTSIHQKEVQRTVKKAGRTLGIATAVTGWFGLSVITKVAKQYSGKRR